MSNALAKDRLKEMGKAAGMAGLHTIGVPKSVAEPLKAAGKTALKSAASHAASHGPALIAKAASQVPGALATGLATGGEAAFDIVSHNTGLLCRQDNVST